VRSSSWQCQLCCITLSLSFLAACSENGASSPVSDGNLPAAATLATRVKYAAAPANAPKAVVYVALSQTILGYPRVNRKGKSAFCSIDPGGFALGMTTDARGSLWVAVEGQGSQYSVQEFARDCGQPGTVLSDPGTAADIAFAPHGTAYVANNLQLSPPGNGLIEVYAKGSTRPTGALTDPSIQQAYYVTTDAAGNVYAAIVQQSNQYAVIEFPGGGMPGTAVKISGFEMPEALIFDRDQNLIVVSEGGSNQLEIYPPPYSGGPARTVPLRGPSQGCVLGQHEAHIFCADASGGVDVYAYPAGTYQYSYSTGGASFAIATYPN
jgi:hypothetical protein